MINSDLVLTSDGSHTLFVAAIDECYHSTHGAIQESRHIFIDAGLKQCTKSEIKILEIGFGTGLNAFMTLLEAESLGKKIHYTTLELYPLDVEKAMRLNYPEELDASKRALFEKIHNAEWDKWIDISNIFSLCKCKADFTQFEFLERFDVVYFDAFSPEKQPAMWTETCFEKLYEVSNVDAVLTTYCAKGYVRRAMQKAGYVVERLPGPPGKRQILRAEKKSL